ncbi:MAG: glycosyltransferase family 61 protein [Solirubrobacterales bacterium]
MFLTRADHQHRRIVNRVEVEAWFRDHGFHVVDFGRLPFAEQLRLTRGAEVVVGPDGSSLLVSLFGRSGLRVGVLDNPHLADNEWYVAMCRRLGQPVSYLVGEVVRDAPDYWYHADYRIDVAHLPGFVDDLLRR